MARATFWLPSRAERDHVARELLRRIRQAVPQRQLSCMSGGLRLIWEYRQADSVGAAALSAQGPVVVVNVYCWAQLNREQRAEFVAHEAAHIVADGIRGPGGGHDVVWRGIMRGFGYIPRAVLPKHEIAA